MAEPKDQKSKLRIQPSADTDLKSGFGAFAGMTLLCPNLTGLRRAGREAKWQ